MAQVAFGQSAWITDILELLERQLAVGTKLARERVFSYLGEPDDLLNNPPGDKFVAVGCESFPIDQRITAGAGAEHTAFDAVFRADIFARLGTDREFTDPKFLRDNSFGLGKLTKDAMTAVHVWGAVTGLASYLREPMRALGVWANPRKPPTGWGWMRIRMQAKFRTDFVALGGGNGGGGGALDSVLDGNIDNYIIDGNP